MKHDKEYELLLNTSIESLPISEEAKTKCIRFHIKLIRDLLNERFDELDQLIGRKFVNELRLFAEINELSVSDRDPIEWMDFMRPIDQDEDLSCGKFKLRQFNFSQADCHPTLDLWAKYLLMNNLMLIDVEGLVKCQSSVKRFTCLIGAQNPENLSFYCISEQGIGQIMPNEKVKDTDHFVVSKI